MKWFSTSLVVHLTLFASTGAAQLFTQSISNATTFVTATTATVTNAQSNPTSLSPCGIVSSISSKSKAGDASPTNPPYVPPSVALSCLQSVPLDLTRSSALVDYIASFMEFQTTLAFLANPPPGYLIPGVDIMGGLKNIKENLAEGVYQSQWDFELDVHELINVLPKDGHLSWSMPLMSTFEVFTRESLVSVSTDGLAIPDVYVTADLQRVRLSNTSLSWIPSPVVSIDGKPVTVYLQSLATSFGGQQDPDAIYNLIFRSIPYLSQKNGDDFATVTGNAYAVSFISDTTNWTFANGSSSQFQNRAYFGAVDFTGIDSGSALFSKAEFPDDTTQGSSPSTSAATSLTAAPEPTTSTATTPLPTVTGYPYPVIKHYGDIVAGYFLNDSDTSDTAVLAITSFEYEDPQTKDTGAGAIEMQRVIEAFLADCVAAGKAKLIIDLSANGGGIVMNGYDTFKQLFPTVIPFGGSRFRESTVFNFLGEVSSAAGTLGYYNQTFNAPFQVQATLDENLDPFPNWQAEYGPFQANGDNFTSLLRFNLSDPIQTGAITVTGYGNRTNPPPQPFAAENIVLIYDGYCASTCTIFSDMMKRQAGVRSIALGGRPQSLPMQAIGGTKGSSILGVKLFQGFYEELLQLQPLAAQSNITFPAIPSLPSGQPPLGPALGGSSPSVNARNAYPADNPTGPPLQFVYEAANCRLFYTYKDTYDVTSVWKRVADVVWGNGTCVPGSTTTADGKLPGSANDTVPFSAAVVSNASLPVGAGKANTTGPPSSTSSLASSGTTGTALPTSTGAAGALSFNLLFVAGMVSAVFGVLL